MSLSIASNISALDSQRSLGIAQRNLAGNMAHLSSGMRINGAADDAAGLAISEQMGADIKSYSQAQRNANDGVSMMQVADGAMSQQAALLTRMKELATQAANDTNGTAQRADADTEYQQLAKEVDRISASTQFNGTAMLASSTTVQFQVGTGANTTNDQISVTVAKTDTATLWGATVGDLKNLTNANKELTAIDTAITTLATAQATVGAAVNRLTSAADTASAFQVNLSAAQSRIRDVDVASESANMSRNNILVQAGTAVLAQANKLPEAALTLLR